MADGHVNNVSDEEDDSENNCYQYELKGVLSKWTNYIHGWQRRFIVLKDGTLSYYKSEQETGFGCRARASVVLPRADVKERKTSLEIVPISKISNSRGADQKYKLIVMERQLRTV
ncbi:Collagen type IV alpha-3-binding protein [Homalodisca vitripennis]|nr:Collagen type IV alpha-3-binding protein [Homalodisca vitripennis]